MQDSNRAFTHSVPTQQGWSTEQALESLPANRGRNLDSLSRYF